MRPHGFPGGGDAHALYHSITEKLFRLPDDTRVWPEHDYQGRAVSSIDVAVPANLALGIRQDETGARTAQAPESK